MIRMWLRKPLGSGVRTATMNDQTGVLARPHKGPSPLLSSGRMGAESSPIQMTCGPELRASIETASDAAGLDMTQYMRQSTRLRLYLDEHGWTPECLEQAEQLVRHGAWTGL